MDKSKWIYWFVDAEFLETNRLASAKQCHGEINAHGKRGSGRILLDFFASCSC